jgi:hypothetical protein
MKLDILSYFRENFGSILGWALALFMVIRLSVGFQTYASAMNQLKKGVGSILYLLGAVIYDISPVDLIPDIIPVFGLIDDLTITIGSIYYANIALKKVFWGEYPPKNRLSVFLVWYGGSVLLVYLIKYTIYLS